VNRCCLKDVSWNVFVFVCDAGTVGACFRCPTCRRRVLSGGSGDCRVASLLASAALSARLAGNGAYSMRARSIPSQTWAIKRTSEGGEVARFDPVRRVTDVAGSTCTRFRGGIVGIRMTFTASQHNCASRVNALRLGGNGPYSRRARRDTSFSCGRTADNGLRKLPLRRSPPRWDLRTDTPPGQLPIPKTTSNQRLLASSRIREQLQRLGTSLGR
jgi:hypothetical protein